MNYLSMVACVKNEAPYLREWIEFHLMVGVQMFYFYDNGSIDGSAAIIQPYVRAGVARLFFVEMEACQMACYYHALSYRDRNRWMAFIDLDEFLFCPDGRPLPALLQEFEEFPALGVSEIIYGSSGHRTKPAGPVIENFTRRARPDHPVHRMMKSIVHPQRTLCPAFCPHYFIHMNTQLPQVDENRLPTQGDGRGPNAPWTVQRIRLNHYLTKSHEEWIAKRNRGRADLLRDHPESVRQQEEFQYYDCNELEDTAIHRYLPELKQRLA